MTRNHSLEDFEKTVKALQERRADTPLEKKLGWYLRYVPEPIREVYNDYRIEDYQKAHGEEKLNEKLNFDKEKKDDKKE